MTIISQTQDLIFVSLLVVLSQYIIQLYTVFSSFNTTLVRSHNCKWTSITPILPFYNHKIVHRPQFLHYYPIMITQQYMDLSYFSTTPLRSYYRIVFTSTCVLVTRPLWVRRCHHLNTSLATNLQFRFESSGLSLMTYMRTIALSWGLGQFIGILTSFVTLAQQEGVFL